MKWGVTYRLKVAVMGYEKGTLIRRVAGDHKGINENDPEKWYCAEKISAPSWTIGVTPQMIEIVH